MKAPTILVFAMAIACANAQTVPPPSDKPDVAFEVASVRLNNSGDHRSSSHNRNGELITNNVSLKHLIERAYNVKDYSLAGPDWLDSVRLDIVAKPPAGTQKDQLQPMMQALLIERFKLQTHREPKTLSAYALLVAKGGPKLSPSSEVKGNTNTNSERGKLIAKGATMVTLADFLSERLELPVIDKTNVDGAFDFTLNWTPDPTTENDHGDPNSSAPSLFTALQEQLGLRLQKDKLPIQILVVDHVEKEPVEN
jgi:uncharacterized protein (TIGR03435 family)